MTFRQSITIPSYRHLSFSHGSTVLYSWPSLSSVRSFRCCSRQTLPQYSSQLYSDITVYRSYAGVFRAATKKSASYQFSSRRQVCQFAYDSFVWTFNARQRPYRYLVAEPTFEHDLTHTGNGSSVEGNGSTRRRFTNTYVCFPSIGVTSNREELRELCRQLTVQPINDGGSMESGYVCGETSSNTNAGVVYNQCICVEWPGLHNDPSINISLKPIMVRLFDEDKNYVGRTEKSPVQHFNDVGKDNAILSNTTDYKSDDDNQRHHSFDRRYGENTSKGEISTSRHDESAATSSTLLSTTQSLCITDDFSSKSVEVVTQLNNLSPAITAPSASLPAIMQTVMPATLSLMETVLLIYKDFVSQFLWHILHDWQCPGVIIVTVGKSAPVVVRVINEVLRGGNVVTEVGYEGIWAGNEHLVQEFGERLLGQVQSIVMLSPAWQSPLRRYNFNRRADRKHKGRQWVDQSLLDENQFQSKENNTSSCQTITCSFETAQDENIQDKANKLYEKSVYSRYKLPDSTMSKQFRNVVAWLQWRGQVGNLIRKFLVSEFFVRRSCQKGYVGNISKDMLEKKLFAISRLTFYEIHAAVWCGLLDPYETEEEFVKDFICLFIMSDEASDPLRNWKRMKCHLVVGKNSADDVIDNLCK